jgi:hypothetical protein
MKRFAYAILGLALTVSGSGCCGCLSHLFHPYGYGGGACNPCGNPCGQYAPMGGGACPGGACGYGPMGYAAPIGGTAMIGNAPTYAAVANNPPL